MLQSLVTSSTAGALLDGEYRPLASFLSLLLSAPLPRERYSRLSAATTSSSIFLPLYTARRGFLNRALLLPLLYNHSDNKRLVNFTLDRVLSLYSLPLCIELCAAAVCALC